MAIDKMPGCCGDRMNEKTIQKIETLQGDKTIDNETKRRKREKFRK